MEQIVKVFSHIARDIQVYCLSGLIVAANLYFLNHLSVFGYSSIDLNGWTILSILGGCYIVGHITFAFMFVFFERTTLEKHIKSMLGFKVSDEESYLRKERVIFKNDKAIYKQFVERYNTLNLMTWNLSGAVLFSSVIAALKTVWIQAAILFVLWWPLYVLSLKREKEWYLRIDAMYEYNMVGLGI